MRLGKSQISALNSVRILENGPHPPHPRSFWKYPRDGCTDDGQRRKEVKSKEETLLNNSVLKTTATQGGEI